MQVFARLTLKFGEANRSGVCRLSSIEVPVQRAVEHEWLGSSPRVHRSVRDSPYPARVRRLQVEHRPSLSEKVERSVGLCIGRHRRGLGSSFRLLCKPDGVAVEYQFFLYSPLLTSIEVRAKPRKRYRKSKLYYMRERVNEISFPKPIRRDDKGEVVVPKGKEGKKGPRR